MKKTLKNCPIILCLSLAIIACYNEIEPEPPSVRNGLLPIAGAFNVRDLGGYKGADGKEIVYGKIIRSGDLNMLTDRDMDYLYGRIGIKTIVDFRNTTPGADGKSERDKAPDRKPKDGSVLIWDVDGGGASTAIPEDIVIPDYQALIEDIRTYPDVATILSKTTQGYRALINDPIAKGAYKSFFQALLAKGNEPFLYHCSAGKDRAGLATALLFLALGVSQQDIINNYMLSAEFVEEKYFPVVPFIINSTRQGMIEQQNRFKPQYETLKQQYEAGVKQVEEGIIAGIKQQMSQVPNIEFMTKEQLNLMLQGFGRPTIDEMLALEIQTNPELSQLNQLPQLIRLIEMTPEEIEAQAQNAGIKIAPLLTVHKVWIEAALDEVQKLGGINAYLTSLDLPSDTIQKLQAFYLK